MFVETQTFNPVNGLPYVANEINYIKIPYMTLNEFQYAIRQALCSFEGITHFKWDQDNFAYEIEYASRPIEITAPKDVLKIIRDKKYAAHVASIRAEEIFPYIQEEDDLTQLDIIPSFTRKWCQCKIHLAWDIFQDCLVYNFERSTGDKISYIDMRMSLYKQLQQIEKIQNDLKDALVEAGVDITTINLRDYLMCDLV
jgi:hypothetical protein